MVKRQRAALVALTVTALVALSELARYLHPEFLGV